jgi:hypothetical protein
MNISLIDKTETCSLTGLRENNPKFIVVHRTKSYPDFESLLAHHRDNLWNGVGYHIFVGKNNESYKCRPFDKEGAHAFGFNTNSISLCFYEPDSRLSREKINIGKETIAFLNDAFGNPELVSHTQAQAIYNNMLFKKYDLDYNLPVDINIVKEENFRMLECHLEKIIAKLPSEKYYPLKSSLKYFKNCPGEIFYQILEN